MRKSNGFTLVELLITISIIAILVTIGVVIYSSALKSGRDAKRQSDLRSIQSALEQYHNDQGFYPAAGLDTNLAASPPPAFTNCTGNVSPCTVTKTYMNQLPQDPKSPPRYKYESLPSTCDNSTTANRCTSYCLYAKLENSNPGLLSGCPNTTYNFTVTPP